MVKVGGPGKHNPEVLANVENPAECSCPPGSIWTNLTEEELKIHFLSGVYNVPHSGYSRCILTKSENQPIEPGAYIDITFDQETDEQGDIHFVGVNNDRVVIKEGCVYFISYIIEFEGAVSINYRARIRINDEDVILRKDIDVPKTASASIFLSCSGIYKALADGFITLQAAQYNDVSLNVIKDNTTLMAQRLF